MANAAKTARRQQKADQKNQDSLVNLQASQLAAQVANWAAQLEYQKERMRLLELPQMQNASQAVIDRLAFDKGQAAWENSFKEASLTGTINGQPTMEWMTQQAQLTGVLNGQQTLQGKLTDAQVAQMSASMANTQRLTDLEYSKYNTGREQWSAEHQMALEKQQAQLTGYINGLPTFEREQWTASNKLATANLIASLSGPASAFKQVAVIRNLTGVEPSIGGVTDSLRDVLQGNGQSVAGFGQGTGGAPPANPYSPFYQAPQAGVTGSDQPAQQPPTTNIPSGGSDDQVGYSGFNPAAQPVTAPPPGTLPPPGTPGVNIPAGTADNQVGYSGAIQPYSLEPSGVQGDPNQYNYEPTATGGVKIYPPGVIPPYATPQASTTQPVDPTTQAQLAQQAGQIPGAAPTKSPVAQAAAYPSQPSYGLLPSQMNAKNFNNLTGYEQDMTWAGFEDGQFGSGAYDKNLAKNLYAKSLPQYAAPTSGSIRL
jgi:hypothetical protein